MPKQMQQPPFRVGPSLWARLLALAAATLLAGCAQFSFPTTAGNSLPDESDAEAEPETAETSPQAIPEPQEDPEPGKLYEWSGNGRDISHVVIDTNEQRARFYDGQEQVGWTTIASGLSSHPTPSGEFQVMEKVAKKRSNLYGRIYNASGGLHKSNARSSDPIPPGGQFRGARMPHFMRMTYDGIGMHAGPIPRPGQPASHGCIRLPSEIASSLFAHTDIGTRVTVIGNGPDYGNYAERIRRQREQEALNRVAAANAEPSSPRSGTRSTAASGSSTQRPASARAGQPPQPGTNGRPATAGSDASAPVSSSNRSVSEQDQRPEASEPVAGSSAGDGAAAAGRGNAGGGPETARRSQMPASADRSDVTASALSTTDITGSGTNNAASSPETVPLAAQQSERTQVPEREAASARTAKPETAAGTRPSTAGGDSAPTRNEQTTPSPRANGSLRGAQPSPTAPPRSPATEAPQVRSADGSQPAAPKESG